MGKPTATGNSGDKARAELADLIDLQMSPLGIVAIDALDAGLGHTILDVGCGAGETILQLMERVGKDGRVIGVDNAPLVLEVARSRTQHLPQVTLLRENAETLSIPSGSFDRIFSRFGVMFFDDPFRAFSNMRRMLRPKGRISFVCWRSVTENELDRLPLQAAGLPVEGDVPHFSFENAETIKHILCTAGFDQIVCEPHDASVPVERSTRCWTW
jgi:SAM-dependent methyltransferase